MGSRSGFKVPVGRFISIGKKSCSQGSFGGFSLRTAARRNRTGLLPGRAEPEPLAALRHAAVTSHTEPR